MNYGHSAVWYFQRFSGPTVGTIHRIRVVSFTLRAARFLFALIIGPIGLGIKDSVRPPSTSGAKERWEFSQYAGDAQGFGVSKARIWSCITSSKPLMVSKMLCCSACVGTERCAWWS